MAYLRKRRYSRRKSGSYKGKTTTKRSAPRYRSTGRTRRSIRKRPMSTRSILNKTSRKKRNGMLTFSNSTATGALATVSQSPLTIAGSPSGNTLGLVHFRPTAMDLNDTSSNPNSIVNTPVRTASICYMRGFAENIRIETSTGNPWFHRRVCITTRDPLFYVQNTADPAGADRGYAAAGAIETSNGWQRLASNIITDTLTATQTSWLTILFKGAQGNDWDDFITAPIDTNRVDLKFDKTWIYKSGNERGVLRERKIWHPMNKNLYYDDDENGAQETTTNFSVRDKRGMGDYHIFDFFSQGSSGSTSDLLKIRFTSTMYWHEK
uniref:Capsid protein n=1 Tax=Tarsiger cyanurus Genomoviridae sp. TaxID=2814994 RepID=A0A8E7L4P3_9VIRU|nr:MAG: capsid protein [Gemycircularvirus]